VVNEGFSMGVPVIVSDRCGVADIVDHGRSGLVFRSDDEADLRAAVRRFLTPGVVEAFAAAAAAGALISAERAAEYLVACLRHLVGENNAKPMPPWLPNARGGRAARG